MNRSRRGTYVWLLLLGFAVALVILGGLLGTAAMVTPQVALALLTAYALIAVPSVASFEMKRLQFSLPRISANVRMTPAARKATQRAYIRHSPGDPSVTDLGLIVNERRDDGQWKRRLAQVVAMDDGAVQPYVSLHVPPESSNRLGLVTFDLYDQVGQARLSRQVEQWLRDGDNLIVCDRQLPLDHDDSAQSRSGVWDLRVKVDGDLVAIHNFNVVPAKSTHQNAHRSHENHGAGISIAVPEDEAPVSLEALLNAQRRDSGSNSSHK